MSDREFALRLARIILEAAEASPDDRNAPLTIKIRQLVRDLEAAPFPETGLEPRGCPVPGACVCPVPERRTITREEFEDVMYALGANGLFNHRAHAEAILTKWRLTVEK